MTTATLAFLIGSAILAQVLAIAASGLRRRRSRYRDLASAAKAGPQAAPVLRRTQARSTRGGEGSSFSETAMLAGLDPRADTLPLS